MKKFNILRTYILSDERIIIVNALAMCFMEKKLKISNCNELVIDYFINNLLRDGGVCTLQIKTVSCCKGKI